LATKDFYSILGVARNVSQEDIKKAYRGLAKEWHPDLHQGKETLEDAEERFKEISEAYSVLSDPEKRRNYDLSGSPEGRSPFGFRATGNPFDIIFQSMMAQQRRPQNAVLRGQTVQLSLGLNLAEAIFGTVSELNYQVLSICESCKGEGGLDFEQCVICRGSGMQTQQHQNMFMQTVCGACGGRGGAPKNPCTTCNKQGVVPSNKTVKVSVPAGARHGSRLSFGGQGGAGFNGGPAGDLLLEIQVSYPDPSKYSQEEAESLKTLLSKT